MSNFFLLLKCDLLKLFDINKILHEKKASGKVKFLMLVIAIVLVGVVIAFISSSYTMLFASVLPAKQKHLALSYICFIYSTIIFFTTIGGSKIIFGASDYETIMAFPISSRVLLLSKLTYLYIVNFLLGALILIPSALMYMLRTDYLIIHVINGVISAFFAPLFPMALGLIIGTLVNVIMAKVKRKGVIGVIFSVVFFTFYFFLFLSLAGGISKDKISDILIEGTKHLWFFNVYAEGIKGELSDLIFYCALSFVAYAIYVYILGLIFKKVNTLISSKRTTGKFKGEKHKQQSIFKILAFKDIKQFFSSSTMVINSLFAPMFSILLAMVFISQGGMSRVAEMVNDPFLINTVKRMISSYLPYLPLFFIGITTYSAYSISIEGKSLWVMKSLPIPAKYVIREKIVVNCMMTMPAGIISVLVYGIAFQSVWYDVLISAIIVATYSVFGGFLGVFVNLKFNNFEWTNLVEVIKRGTSSMICAIIGIFGVLILALIQYFTFSISKYLGYGIVYSIILISIAVLWAILRKNGEKYLMELGNN